MYTGPKVERIPKFEIYSGLVLIVIALVLFLALGSTVIDANASTKLTWKYTQFNPDWGGASTEQALVFLNKLPEGRALEAKVTYNRNTVCIFYRE